MKRDERFQMIALFRERAEFRETELQFQLNSINIEFHAKSFIDGSDKTP